MVKSSTADQHLGTPSLSQGVARWQREMKIVFDSREMDSFFDAFLPLDAYLLFPVTDGSEES